MENPNLFFLQKKIELQKGYEKLIKTSQKMRNVTISLKEALITFEAIDKIENNSSQNLNATKTKFSK